MHESLASRPRTLRAQAGGVTAPTETGLNLPSTKASIAPALRLRQDSAARINEPDGALLPSTTTQRPTQSFEQRAGWATDSSGHARLVQQLPEGSVGDLLTRALQLGLPMKVSVIVDGRFQHLCGPLRRVTLSHPWLLAESSGRTLKLREDLIAGIWLMRQPCHGGLRCWLELIDAHGALHATLGSGGTTGLREPCEWRLLLESLCDGQTSSQPPGLRLAD